MTMKFTTISGLAVLFFSVISASVAGTKLSNRPFSASAQALRSSWNMLSTESESSRHYQKAMNVLSETKYTKHLTGGVLSYLKARAAFLLGDKKAAEDDMSSAFSRPTAPERVLGLLELHGKARNVREAYGRLLAELLPLSGWQASVDARKTEGTALIQPAPTVVPVFNRQSLIHIANSLEKARLYDRAWRAYAEVAYVGFTPSWMAGEVDGSWLSPEAAEYWYKAAGCARLAGKQELAWGYLMKAAVFGCDDLYKKAQVTAERWSEQAKPVAPRQVDPKIKRQALVKIVHLYMDMNADPRAWELIDSHWEDFDHPDELRKQVETHWLAVVKDVSRAATKVVLYGHEVYPHGDPMDVTIPWALSDEAIASVQKRLQKDKESLRASN